MVEVTLVTNNAVIEINETVVEVAIVTENPTVEINETVVDVEIVTENPIVEINETVINVEIVTETLNIDLGNSGVPGNAGPGVATGGTTGQVLKKLSNTNYDTAWQDESDALNSVVAGTNISVDNTDPNNPVINSLSDRYKTTSSTSNAIVSSGNLTFTVDSNLAYISQQEVIIAYDVNNHMHGTVVSYSGTTLVVSIKQKMGSGTYSAWSINLDGTPVNAIAGSGTANQIAYFTAAQTIQSLPTANYPNLNELAQLKEVNKTLTYTSNKLTNITYASGLEKDITYNIDGTVNTVTITNPDASVVVKTMAWSGGLLTGVTVS